MQDQNMEVTSVLFYVTAQWSEPFLGDLFSTVHLQFEVFPVLIHHYPVNRLIFGLFVLQGVQAPTQLQIQNSSCPREAMSRAREVARLGNLELCPRRSSMCIRPMLSTCN